MVFGKESGLPFGMVQFQGLGVYISEFMSVQAYHIGKTLPTKNDWTVKPSRRKPLIQN